MNDMKAKSLRQIARLKNNLLMLRSRLISKRQIHATKVCVCIAVLNRSGHRVENCLATLRSQSVPSEMVEIILADMGSAPEYTDSLCALASKFKARVLLLKDPDRGWNRAWTMNCAIRTSHPESKVTIVTDIDCLLEHNFVEETIRVHLAFPGRTFGVCGVTDLPEGSTGEGVSVTEGFNSLREMGSIVRDVGIGASQSFWRQWLFRVRGYDERYRIYGYEDNDMERRAGMEKLWFADLTRRTAVLHQWHQPAIRGCGIEDERTYREAVEQNRVLYGSASGVIRNPCGWGEVPSHAELVEPSWMS